MNLLKIATFNVQLPSTIMEEGQGEDDRAVERADALCDAIIALPNRDQPDVMAFNEVFNESARSELLSRLSGSWPNVLKKIDDGGFDEDSGLMFFSRHPFLALPKGGTSASHTYENSAMPDALAGKSVAMVRIAFPDQPTTIVFTHTQASYDARNSENRSIREKQLDEIMQFLKDQLGPNIPDWLNVIIMGDLNIKGDPDSTTDEWDHVFDSGLVELGNNFLDGWRTFMHNPTSNDEHDPGFTQRDLGSGQLNRLDYQLFCKLPPDVRRIVPHYMFTPLREQSDHWSLVARVQHLSPQCNPVTAIDILATAPLSTGSAPGHVQSEVRIASLNIADPGACQWTFVSQPGTYSVFSTANVETVYFSQDDFTHPLARLDQISFNDLPANVVNFLRQHNRFVSKGDVVVSRTPFFIRTRGKDDLTTGSATVGLIKHRGDSQATAIVLFPNLETDPGVPFAQTLGDDDVCWFRADIPTKFDGDTYTPQFILRNRTGGAKAVVTILDPAATVIVPSNPSTASELRTPFPTVGEQVFLTLQRASLNDVAFTMEMATGLTFLLTDQPIVLHVDDETGPDWLGSDSFDLSIGVDAQELLTDSWDDADADEDWPDLAKKVRDNAILKKKSLAADLSFTSGISVSVLKTDGIAAHGSSATVITPLTKDDKEIEPRTGSITISDPAGDGGLTFSCTLSKFPSGH